MFDVSAENKIPHLLQSFLCHLIVIEGHSHCELVELPFHQLIFNIIIVLLYLHIAGALILNIYSILSTTACEIPDQLLV